MSKTRRPWRPMIAGGLALVLVVGVQAVLGASPADAATTFGVTSTADIAANAGACGNTAILTPPNPAALSLREAVCLANNNGGTATINIPAGTYNLTHGHLMVGLHSGQNVTLSGAGAASTTINAGGNSGVLDFDDSILGNIAGTVSGLTIEGGAENTYGGAGIIAGSNVDSSADTLTIESSVITGNNADGATPTNTTEPGGGVQFIGGTLNISDSTISNNSSASSPGAGVAYAATGGSAGQALTIDNTTFSGNTMLNTNGSSVTNGGALDVRGLSSTQFSVTNSRFVDNSVVATTGGGVGAAIRQESGALTVTGSTFTGNSVSGAALSLVGGAIGITTGTATLHYNRFFGNTAAAGEALAVGSGAGAVDAAENWFGCNGGPATLSCDSVSGSATLTPRLQFDASADPATVNGPNATSTVAGSLTVDSAGNPVDAADLGAFAGQPIVFGSPLPSPATINGGTVNASVNLTSGQAGATYNSQSSSGPGSVHATFDNATISVPIAVDRVPAITTNPSAQSVHAGDIATFTAAASGVPAPTVQWQLSTDGGTAFTDIGGATASTYSFTAAAADTGNQYRAVFSNTTDAPHSATTTAATLTVGQPSAFTSGTIATFVTGGSETFHITTSGIPAVTAISETGALPSGITFADNGDGTATLNGTPAAGTGGTYAIILTSVSGVSPDGSQALTVQVNDAPAITTNPAGQTVNPGTPVSFSAAASGVPAPSVQWQRSTDGGNTFTDIDGATSSTYSFTAALTDDGSEYRAVFTNLLDSATSTAATLRVGTAPAFITLPEVAFTASVASSANLAVSGMPNPTIGHTGTLPSWLTLTDNGDGTATLSGTPPVGSGGEYSFTLTASNGFAPDASQLFTVFVYESPTITSADHATFVLGSARSFAVATHGGYPTPIVISESGLLPAGVTLVDHGDGTAILSGTPQAGTAGTYRFIVSAAVTGGAVQSPPQTFTLTVDGPPAITSAGQATFTVGAVGDFVVHTAAGTPVATVLSESGALPSGVSFVDNGDGTASLQGTPAAGTGGTYPVTVTASNGVAPDATQSFTLTVDQLPVISSADRVSVVVGTAGAFTVTSVAGFPVSTVLSESGVLPGGITFTDNGGGTATLAGTPVAGSGGVYPLTFSATNGTGHVDQSFTLTVDEATAISSADHVTFTAGSAGTFTVSTAGGFPTSPTVTQSGVLPAGVTFVDNGDGTGTLAGTPAAGTGGSYPFTITAANGIDPGAVQSFTLTVDQAPAITSADHTGLTVGARGTFAVSTTGFPAPGLTETGALPSGVTFTDNGHGGATLAGTPAAGSAGAYPLTITATNAADHDQQSFVLTVVRAAQAITFTSTPPSAIADGGYSPTATADSGLTVSFSIDAATTDSSCTLDGSTVSFEQVGTCVIDADQAGDGTYLPAPQVQQTITVGSVVTSTTLASSTSPSVFGQPAHVTATVTAGGTPPSGSVQFAVDGTDLGAPVVLAGGQAASPELTDSSGGPLAPGSHLITAAFTPDAATVYASSQISITQVVGQAATTLAVAAGNATLTATVAVVSPGAGNPTGEVAFSVDGHPIGNAPLTGGVATMNFVGNAGSTQQVSAAYSGDTNFASSTAATAVTTAQTVATIGQSSVVAGGSETATASGFVPGELVDATLHSAPIDLGTVTADSRGDVSITFAVPANLPAGEHHVVFTGETSSRTASIAFVVTAPASAPTPPASTPSQPATPLASTGEPQNRALLLAALLALMAGAVLTISGRRRSGSRGGFRSGSHPRSD